MGEFWDRLLNAAIKNKGKIAGVVTALFISWIFLAHGFWRALVVFVVLVTGYTLGARFDSGQRVTPETIVQYFSRRRR